MLDPKSIRVNENLFYQEQGNRIPVRVKRKPFKDAHTGEWMIHCHDFMQALPFKQMLPRIAGIRKKPVKSIFFTRITAEDLFKLMAINLPGHYHKPTNKWFLFQNRIPISINDMAFDDDKFTARLSYLYIDENETCDTSIEYDYFSQSIRFIADGHPVFINIVETYRYLRILDKMKWQADG